MTSKFAVNGVVVPSKVRSLKKAALWYLKDHAKITPHYIVTLEITNLYDNKTWQMTLGPVWGVRELKGE